MTLDLKGQRLNLLQSIELSKGTASLGMASEDGTERR